MQTLGLVSPTSVPFTSVRLGKSTYQITTSIGNVLQTYDFKRGLSLVFASQPRTPKPITATFAWKNVVFAAWGGQQVGDESGVWVFRRGKKIASLEATPSFAGPVTRLLVFGSWIVGCCESCIQVWNSTSYAHYTTLIAKPSRSTPDLPIFTGNICTMPTYLNKIFAGRYDGTVEIWNISSGKLLHTILPLTAQDGAVTAIEPTPALSHIAIAYKAGTVVVRNVDTEQAVLSLNSNSPHPVTSISFRTDGIGAGDEGRLPGVMATATSYSGDITLWDLNNGGRRTGSLREAHELHQKDSDGGVNKIEFLDGQPFLISSGRDNALRSWIFDESPFSPIPRMLHSRGGHAAAVSALSFLPASSDGSDSAGKWLLSGSKDQSLWGFSLRKDSQNSELSQGNIKSKSQKKGILRSGPTSEDLKAPEITSIACSLNRDAGMGASSQQVWTNSKDAKKSSQNANGWESVVTGHKGDKFARTWYWGKKKAGRWAFETSDGTEVKVCDLFLFRHACFSLMY
jgi:U3 small nucleolar RNA-associated protein 21